MTNEAIACIIFVVCVFLFVTKFVNTCVAAGIGCVAFVVSGVCDFQTAFAGFSNSLPIMIFASLCVGDAMSQTGLDKIIGMYVVKISRNNERLFIFLAGLVSGLLSMWMSNTAVVASFLPILSGISRISDKMFMKNMTMSVTFGAMFGGACTLVGSTSQLAVQGVMKEMTGLEFKMFTLMPVGIILLIAYLAMIQLFGYRLGIRIWGDRYEEGLQVVEATDVDTDESMSGVRKRRRVTVVIVFAFMVISYIFEFFPTHITALIAALSCFVLRCSDPKKAMKNIDWNSVLFLACTMGLANGLMATNATAIFAEYIGTAFGNSVNPYFFLFVVIIITIATSNFLANATTCVIFTPIIIAACERYGLSPYPFCLAIAYAASTTCMTPMAHAQVTMTLVAGYRFTDYQKFNLPTTILTIAILMIFLPLFFPLT